MAVRYDAQATAFNIQKHAGRQSPGLDIHFLCADDVAWVPQINPRVTGLVPSSRMHFGIVVLGDFLFVIGGVQPSCLAYCSAGRGGRGGEGKDTSGSGSVAGASEGGESDERLVIHALDVMTLAWSEPKSMETADYLEGPIRVAQNDISRALQRVESERSRGLAMGT